MCSRAGARSVAAMRPSLLRLTAAAGATAAVLAVAHRRARRGRRLRRHHPRRRRRSSSRPTPSRTTLRSIVISWRATCADGSWIPGGGDADAGRARPRLRARPQRAAGRPATPRAASRARSSRRRDLGDAPSARSSSRSRASSSPTRASGTLTVMVKIIDKATGADVTSCQIDPELGRDPRARDRLRRRHLAGRAARRAPERAAQAGQRRLPTWSRDRAPASGLLPASPTTSSTSPSRARVVRQPVQRRRRDRRRRQAPLRLHARRQAEQDRRQGARCRSRSPRPTRPASRRTAATPAA